MKIEIVLIVLVILFYNYFVSEYYFDQNTLRVRYIPLALFGLFAFLIFVITIASVFYYRTTFYVNHFKNDNVLAKYEDDKKDITNEQYIERFNYIKIIKLSIPDEYKQKLMDIAKYNGIRIEIPKKRQKCISLKKLREVFPQIVEWYKTLPRQISKIIGSKVKITPLTEPNSLCLVVYEQEGDFIDWHFDTNHYNGRYFTLLLPVSSLPTCGNYQYRNSNGNTQTVLLDKDESLLFEGDKVYHKAKKLCANQRRVVLSCTFTTSQKIPTIEYIFQTIKNIGIFGEL
jgi:hypothetical protein